MDKPEELSNRELDESLDSDMASILDDINKVESNEHESSSESAPEANEAKPTEKASDTGEENGERERDEQGRFKATGKDEKRENEASSTESGGEQKVEDQGISLQESGENKTADTEQDGTLINPPASWRAAAKAKWAGLDDDIRREVLKRETEGHTGFQKGIEQYKDAANYGNAMGKVVEPYRQMIERAGSTPERAIQELFSTQHQLINGTPQARGQLIMDIARQYGADLSPYMGAQVKPTEGVEAAQVPATDNALTGRMQAIEHSLQQTRQQEQDLKAQNLQIEEQNALQSINSFQQEMDESGQLKHLYFENVKADMANLLETAHRTGQTLDLDGAYQQAVWSNSETRAILLADQAKQAVTKQQDDAALKAKEAKRSGSTNLQHQGKPLPSVNTEAATGTIEETMRDTLNRIQHRI